MNDAPIRLGPLALLLTVISICLTTLSILTYTTARADMRLAERFAQTVQERYELEAEGQSFLKETAEDIAGGVAFMPDPDGVLRETITSGDTSLQIGLIVLPDGYRVRTWKIMRQWTEDTSFGNLWTGN